MVAVDGGSAPRGGVAGPGPDGSASGAVDDDLAANELVSGLVGEPWGRLSPSIYETGRLVTLAPWLAGHAARVTFLLSTQQADGSWGQPDGYALVPTLSATEALLTTVRRERAPLTDAVDRGLRRLSAWLADMSSRRLPDTPAIELIVPALVAALNRHLAELRDDPVTGLDGWHGGQLPLPSGMDGTLLAAVRSRVEAGADVPDKLLHSLEIVGDAAGAAGAIRPVGPGTVGASPAATAAWLARQSVDADTPALRYLAAVADRHGGPVPSVVPVAPFERAWVLNTLMVGGFDLDLPAELLETIAAPLGETGLSGGAGLPTDADTTSATLFTLAQAGVPRPLTCLWAYETDTHFCTWQGERTPSTTTNAHVLEAFGHHVANHGDARSREWTVVGRLSAWLCDQQVSDGSWSDKWHASAYYATMCCALALYRFGRDGSAAAVRRAAEWVLATQRADGSWGRWQGTVEETAYAMQVLLLTTPADNGMEQAIVRGYAYLSRSVGRRPDPPLWHDKDLYVPTAIVRAAALAALRLARRSARVVALAGRIGVGA